MFTFIKKTLKSTLFTSTLLTSFFLINDAVSFLILWLAVSALASTFLISKVFK